MTMANTARLLDALLADPLAALQGRADAVGFIGADVPVDVLLASRKPFLHLPWRTAGATPWADRWLESSFPYWARSILEQWHEGRFDGIGTVVFSRSEDASQRLFYYVRELKSRGLLRGPVPAMFDIALLPKPSSLAHTTSAVVELMRTLDVSLDDLADGVARANRLRLTLQRLQSQRTDYGPLYERLARAALLSDATTWIDEIVPPERGSGTARLLLAGSAPPDDRLHVAADAGGATIVAETHVRALDRLGLPVPSDGAEPTEQALARHLMASSVGPRAVRDRAQWIVERAAHADAAGVVLWLTREDEALAWHVPAQQRALAAANIPCLVLPAASWQADDGATDRIIDFCRELRRATA
jgi:hypothetical protein